MENLPSNLARLSLEAFLMWHDDDAMAEHMLINSWHRFPKPVPWWAYGILLSLGLSLASVLVSVLG